MAKSSLVKLRTNILPKSCRFSAPGVALSNPVCVTARTSHNTNGISSLDTVFSRTTPRPTPLPVSEITSFGTGLFCLTVWEFLWIQHLGSTYIHIILMSSMSHSNTVTQPHCTPHLHPNQIAMTPPAHCRDALLILKKGSDLGNVFSWKVLAENF